MGCKALKTLAFWKSHFPFDSRMIADTKAILFVLILASEWFAGLLSHPILYWERKRLCWLSVKEGRQSLFYLVKSIISCAKHLKRWIVKYLALLQWFLDYFFVCRDLWLLRFFELLRWFQEVDELFRKQLQKRLRSLLKLFHHLIQLVQFYPLFFVCLKRKRSNICSGFANSLKVYILEYVHQISCHVLSLRNYQSNIIIILLW